MSLLQAAKQALEALEVATTPLQKDRMEVLDAHVALRQAIAQAEQTDLNLNCKSVQKRLATLWGYVKAEQQEPVAIHQWRRKIPADQPWHDDEYKFTYARVDDFHEARTVYAATVPITTPDVCGEVCVRAKLCYGCGKALDETNASWMSHDELKAYWSGYGNGKQKALSEPVAFKFPREPKPEQSMGWTIDYGLIRQIAEDIGDQEFIPSHEGIELVLLSLEGISAAPVRTKDLTDDEIWEALHDKGLMEGIRAVIAADREKNHV